MQKLTVRKWIQRLARCGRMSFTKEEIADAIAQVGLSPSIRGEALTLEQFAELTDKLVEIQKLRK